MLIFVVMNRIQDLLKVKTESTRKLTQQNRKHFALNRASAGFTTELKEITFTLLSDASEGAHLVDVDGNQYIDLTMGFGSILFGHNYAPIREAIEHQLKKHWSVGPMTPLAGELATKIHEVTGVERVAFFNSGTEAVMVALRLAKAVTKKNKIVFFKGAYHGTFDTLLSLKNHPETQLAQEIVPGVTQSILNESYLLEYGHENALTFVEQHADEIAAVLVEPVQSRNPSLQPRDFLHELRSITERLNIALIFDEVICGFRIGVGGAQAFFDVKADLVTYGKVIGGGLPIGIVAGKSDYLDATDGGYWEYGDASIPKVKPTFVAGTFCHHPLAMAASLKVLELLTADNDKVLKTLNERTEKFCQQLNAFFEKEQFPITVSHFASLFRFTTPGKLSLLYNYLLNNGVYVWEGRNCFLSPSHNEEVLAQLFQKIKQSAFEMEEDGILKRKVNK
jgi:glutamate-1-semialdehyde aminotransferase